MVFLFVAVDGCKKDDMFEQPKYKPYEASGTFVDGASARPLVMGVAPRDDLFPPAVAPFNAPSTSPGTPGEGGGEGDFEHQHRSNSETTLTPTLSRSTGRGSKEGGDVMPTLIPFSVTRAVIDRGKERFDIYCSACHGRLGNGRGMIAQRGFPPPPSYHVDRLKQQTDRHFYDVITNGINAMYSFNDRIVPSDRWCIVAYIRALQAMDDSPKLSDEDRRILHGPGDTVHP